MNVYVCSTGYLFRSSLMDLSWATVADPDQSAHRGAAETCQCLHCLNLKPCLHHFGMMVKHLCSNFSRV